MHKSVLMDLFKEEESEEAEESTDAEGQEHDDESSEEDHKSYWIVKRIAETYKTNKKHIVGSEDE